MSQTSPDTPPSAVDVATVRGLSSSGPFTLLPDSTIQFTYIIAAAQVGSDPRNNDTARFELVQTLLSARNWWYAFNPPTSVAENPVAVPTDAIMNYPNPFSSFTTIDAPSGGHVAVYNEMGQDIGVALLHSVSSNEYLFDGRTLPNGMYIVRYSGAGKTYTSKIIVVH
jgi:hypothetical protein